MLPGFDPLWDGARDSVRDNGLRFPFDGDFPEALELKAVVEQLGRRLADPRPDR